MTTQVKEWMSADPVTIEPRGLGAGGARADGRARGPPPARGGLAGARRRGPLDRRPARRAAVGRRGGRERRPARPRRDGRRPGGRADDLRAAHGARRDAARRSGGPDGRAAHRLSARRREPGRAGRHPVGDGRAARARGDALDRRAARAARARHGPRRRWSRGCAPSASASRAGCAGTPRPSGASRRIRRRSRWTSRSAPPTAPRPRAPASSRSSPRSASRRSTARSSAPTRGASRCASAAGGASRWRACRRCPATRSASPARASRDVAAAMELVRPFAQPDARRHPAGRRQERVVRRDDPGARPAGRARAGRLRADRRRLPRALRRPGVRRGGARGAARPRSRATSTRCAWRARAAGARCARRPGPTSSSRQLAPGLRGALAALRRGRDRRRGALERHRRGSPRRELRRPAGDLSERARRWRSSSEACRKCFASLFTDRAIVVPRRARLRAREGAALGRRAEDGALGPGRRRRDLHARHRERLRPRRPDHRDLRTRREHRAGRGEPGRVRGLQAHSGGDLPPPRQQGDRHALRRGRRAAARAIDRCRRRCASSSC